MPPSSPSSDPSAAKSAEPGRVKRDERAAEGDRPNPFNGFALVMILLVLGGGLLLITRLSADSKLQDCVMSGRKNCAPIDLPGSGR